jgi:hypothetical protein
VQPSTATIASPGKRIQNHAGQDHAGQNHASQNRAGQNHTLDSAKNPSSNPSANNPAGRRSGSPRGTRTIKPNRSPRRKSPSLSINVPALDTNVPSPGGGQYIVSPQGYATTSSITTPVDPVTPAADRNYDYSNNLLRKRKNKGSSDNFKGDQVNNNNNSNNSNQQEASRLREGKHLQNLNLKANSSLSKGKHPDSGNPGMVHTVGRALSDRAKDKEKREIRETQQKIYEREIRQGHGERPEDLKHKKFDIYFLVMCSAICSVITAIFCFKGGW